MAQAKKAPGKSLALIKQEMAALAAQEKAAEPVSLGNFLSVKGKQFKFQDAVLDDPLQVIILDHCFENQFFQGTYDSNNPQPPVCYAIGKDEKTLAPPDAKDVEGLQPQADACQGCPHNEFGSADTGKGKACKNSRKLALICVDGELTPEGIAEATVAYLRLSPTALRNFSGYLKRVTTTLQVPLFGVITELSFDQGLDFPSVITTLVNPIEDQAVLAAIMAKRETVQEELVTGPSSLTPRERAQPAKRKPAPARKPPARAAAGGGKGRGKF